MWDLWITSSSLIVLDFCFKNAIRMFYYKFDPGSHLLDCSLFLWREPFIVRKLGEVDCFRRRNQEASSRVTLCLFLVDTPVLVFAYICGCTSLVTRSGFLFKSTLRFFSKRVGNIVEILQRRFKLCWWMWTARKFVASMNALRLKPSIFHALPRIHI